MSPNNMIVELLNHPYERTLADLDQEAQGIHRSRGRGAEARGI